MIDRAIIKEIQNKILIPPRNEYFDIDTKRGYILGLEQALKIIRKYNNQERNIIKGSEVN